MLTTTRPMLAEITAPETLQAAWERIKAKGARGGLDDVSLEEFARDFEARLDELRRHLLEERYVPEPLQQIAVPKGPRAQAPDGGASPLEWRTLGLPTVRDKIAQEAARSIIEPLLERQFLKGARISSPESVWGWFSVSRSGVAAAGLGQPPSRGSLPSGFSAGPARAVPSTLVPVTVSSRAPRSRRPAGREPSRSSSVCAPPERAADRLQAVNDQPPVTKEDLHERPAQHHHLQWRHPE